MKRFFLIILFLMIAPMAVANENFVDQQPDTIILSATAKETIQADEAIINISLVASEESSFKGYKKFEKEIKILLDAIAEIPSEVCATVEFSGISIGPRMGFVREGCDVSPTSVLGSTFSGICFIKIPLKHKTQAKSIKNIVWALEKLTDINISVPNVIFKTSMEDKMQQLLYAKAIENAKQRAEHLAKLSGRKLGKVLTIREVGLPIKSQLFYSSYCDFSVELELQFSVD